ncbi:MAG: response regulator transcription factor, partial [Chitinimonas sp.]|nr:response regulator transcription factor [Chitinimonas sp.]
MAWPVCVSDCWRWAGSWTGLCCSPVCACGPVCRWQRPVDDVRDQLGVDVSKLRIVLAEDQALVRGALAALLGLEPDLAVIAEAGDGRAALALVESLQPDILLTDIEMPLMTGLELAQQVKTLRLPTRVVIVTTFGRAGYLRRAMAAGVGGYLLKDA